MRESECQAPEVGCQEPVPITRAGNRYPVSGIRSLVSAISDLGFAAVGVLLVCAVTFACAETPGPEPEISLRLGYQHALVSLDPHAQNDGVTKAVLAGVYDTLVWLEPGATVRPGLAERWTTPSDTVWRFELREGVRFHDGREMTADDVVSSILRARFDPGSQLSSYMEAIVDVRRVDGEDRAIEVTTAASFPLLLSRISMVAIVPEGFDPSSPVGTGPFRWVSGERQGPIRLARWEGFWGPRPDFDTVIITIVDNNQELDSLLRSAGLDVMAHVSSDFILGRDVGEAWRVAQFPISSTTILGINVTRPPLSDPRVREAIDLAVNRDELVATVYSNGLAEPAVSVVSADVFGFSPRQSARVVDTERARTLLRQAGVPEGSSIRLDHSGVYGPVVEWLIGSISRIGLHVKEQQHSYESFYRRIGEAENELFLFGWTFTFADASDFLDAVVHTRDPEGTFGRLNGAGFSDETADRWIEEAGREPRSRHRLERLRWSLARVEDSHAYLPLFYRSRIALARSHLRLDHRTGPWIRPQDVRLQETP